MQPPHVETNSLSFSYPEIDGGYNDKGNPIIWDFCMKLPPSSRCLLVGMNGAGKSTILKILAGKHMVADGAVRILGYAPFQETKLTTSGDLTYLGGSWVRDIAFAGYSIPLQGDITVNEMISKINNVDKLRLTKLLDVLDIDVAWHMHKVSDGQRRRVQLLMGLIKPFKVLLLDEITVDLDVLGRFELFKFLKEESERRMTTIIYVTHIFDGLNDWPTHLMYVSDGNIKVFDEYKNIEGIHSGEKLLSVITRNNGHASGRMISTWKE